ncbi:MAG: Gfo/Idh/MocA family oxidoreductase [Planctomycetota bacterium]|nr:Gfo/Idh/MocA family oxidoreductase [Planctomycetota bacterium]MEC9047870.1 Gfo/Idh/MocA family oxidoreductase [Planctomycetota bacterium]
MHQPAPEQPLGVAFLGAGAISELHAAAVRSCNGAELRGLWHLDPDEGASKAQRYGCRSYASAQDALADPGVHCVSVLTNLETHREFAELAMRAGKHVLVEKPAGATLEEVASMQRCAQAHGVQCVPVHNYVYEPALERTRTLIDRGELGKLVSVHVLYNIHHPEAVAQRYPGVIRQIMTHHAYVLLYLAGVPVSAAGMKATINDGSVDQENLAVATLQLKCGAIAHLQASFAADDHSGDPWTFLVKVIGTAGSTRFSYRDWVQNQKAQVHSHTFSAYPFHIEQTVHHFLNRCVRHGDAPLSSMQDAYDAQRVIEAVEASIEQQRILQLS